mmetsp:Transcript_5895/g.17445  ORF Transcript_5895/g.17445 Transcript_5895/m.17445 type:complete len:137 (-) Transcript_5895:139-549(-)
MESWLSTFVLRIDIILQRKFKPFLQLIWTPCIQVASAIVFDHDFRGTMVPRRVAAGLVAAALVSIGLLQPGCLQPSEIDSEEWPQLLRLLSPGGRPSEEHHADAPAVQCALQAATQLSMAELRDSCLTAARTMQRR